MHATETKGMALITELRNSPTGFVTAFFAGGNQLCVDGHPRPASLCLGTITSRENHDWGANAVLLSLF
jgi:hypothetical protein